MPAAFQIGVPEGKVGQPSPAGRRVCGAFTT